MRLWCTVTYDGVIARSCIDWQELMLSHAFCWGRKPGWVINWANQMNAVSTKVLLRFFPPVCPFGPSRTSKRVTLEKNKHDNCLRSWIPSVKKYCHIIMMLTKQPLANPFLLPQTPIFPFCRISPAVSYKLGAIHKKHAMSFPPCKTTSSKSRAPYY